MNWKSPSTSSWNREYLQKIERIREEEAARNIQEALNAKRAMEWLASHGCVSTPGFFWDGTGDLVEQVKARQDLERWEKDPELGFKR